MTLEADATDSPTAATVVQTKPWVTVVAVIASLTTFAGLAIKNDYESWSTLALFGYLPAEEIRAGGYWALITSTFVHFALLHGAINA